MRYSILSRLLMIGFAACVCTMLTWKTGIWSSIALWALVMAAMCGGVALLMKRQAPGRVTPINYLAGIVLPWGYRIGRGKLLPIVIESWLRWLLVGLAIIILNTHDSGWPSHSSPPTAAAIYHRSAIASVLLLFSWLANGAVMLVLITNLLTRANSNPIPPGTFGPILLLAALVASSVALTIFGHGTATTRLALLISCGPILVVGGGYGLMILVMLVFGRHTRWT